MRARVSTQKIDWAFYLCSANSSVTLGKLFKPLTFNIFLPGKKMPREEKAEGFQSSQGKMVPKYA